MTANSSDLFRIEALRRRVERSSAPTPELLHDIIAAVGARHVLSPVGRSLQLREWLARKAYAQIAFALVEWDLPEFSVRRLVQENHVWWCAIAHRHMIDWGGEEEDEWHEDMTLAILKSYLTVLCHLPSESDEDGPGPGLSLPIEQPRFAAAVPAPALRLYEILIKTLAPASRSFMRPVK